VFADRMLSDTLNGVANAVMNDCLRRVFAAIDGKPEDA
jgi:hypothetical protein